METTGKANKLIHEKSPYLLQHAHNPVDWMPWGDEAFDRARREGKIIFLSIGYATCHWCHVMAHESFEDEEVARLLNESYVSVKVDREERPDVDQVYMTACQVLTGQGGWPLSVFLTPEGKPFYAGTYFPKHNRLGRPGFMDILIMFRDRWTSDREIVLKAADQLTAALREPEVPSAGRGLPGPETLEAGFRQHQKSYDPQWGGFGNAPKFPAPHHFCFLLRRHHRHGDPQALEMVTRTLTAMRGGGIFDHIGLGFHRYSVDREWLVPHFEKMLYDQALLALAYLEAGQVVGDEFFTGVAREIFTYVLRDMTSPEGAFYAAEDADSEGREGVYYVWRPEEVKEVLGEDRGGLFCEYYGITPEGNFEHGLSIPHVDTSLDDFARARNMPPEQAATVLTEAGAQMLAHRETRERPFKDDKILTAWNGLMIAALARGGQVLGEAAYTRAAAGCARFILEKMKTGESRLLRRYRQGEAAHAAFLEDYAFLAWGLIELYEASFDPEYLAEALNLTRVTIDLFWDKENGGFFFSGLDNEKLVSQKKDAYDGAMPSGNSVAALNLVRLARMTGDAGLEERARELVAAFADQAGQYPMAHTHMLMALDFLTGPGLEIVVTGDPGRETTREMVAAVHKRFLPGKVLLLKPVGNDGLRLSELCPYVEGMKSESGSTLAYVCHNYACRQPVTDPVALSELLDQA